MKKALVLLMFGFILFLTACNSRSSAYTTTVCELAPSSAMTVVEEAVTTIISNDEELVRWTERFTISKEDYEMYFFDTSWFFMSMTDEQIEEFFAPFNDPAYRDGQSWHLISIDGDMLTLEVVHHYDTMTETQASAFWDGDFSQVNVTRAIRGLENRGANCRTN